MKLPAKIARPKGLDAFLEMYSNDGGEDTWFVYTHEELRDLFEELLDRYYTLKEMS